MWFKPCLTCLLELMKILFMLVNLEMLIVIGVGMISDEYCPSCHDEILEVNIAMMKWSIFIVIIVSLVYCEHKNGIRELCPICYDTITDLAILEPCLHKFDYHCIMPWLNISSRCPYCTQGASHIRHYHEWWKYRNHTVYEEVNLIMSTYNCSKWLTTINDR